MTQRQSAARVADRPTPVIGAPKKAAAEPTFVQDIKSMNTTIAPFAYAVIAVTAIVAGGCAAPQNLQARFRTHTDLPSSEWVFRRIQPARAANRWAAALRRRFAHPANRS